MKRYTVYFIIKKNNHGYLNEKTVIAHNQKEAVKLVRESVKAESGRNAFKCTCKKPELVPSGMKYGGIVYTRYSPIFHSLW